MSVAVALAAGSLSLSTPSLSTRSSKLFALPLFALLLSSRTRPRSKISALARRRRSAASGESSSRVDASGDRGRLDLGRGASSSPRS